MSVGPNSVCVVHMWDPTEMCSGVRTPRRDSRVSLPTCKRPPNDLYHVLSYTMRKTLLMFQR